MATFKITANSTVKSFSKAFKEEFGATLQIYDGRLKADDSVKLVDISVKTGTFECRANRTVGSFVKMMQDEFNMKVKVRTADDWVTVIDGLTLNRINDLPKQPTKSMMEDYVSYQRKDTKSEEKAEESPSQNEIKSEPEEEIVLFEGTIPTLSFTKKEKRNALENSKGIIVMARQLMNLSDLETLIRYQEEEDMMVLIAINNKTGHVGAIEMMDSVDGILNMFKRKCNIDSLEDYTIYYTSIECSTDDEKEFIETGYRPLYLDKNKVGMSDRHCFAESELRKTLNKKFNNAIYADLDIFAGMNKIYSCNMIEVY